MLLVICYTAVRHVSYYLFTAFICVFASVRNKDTPLLEEPNVVKIARKYNKTPAQVLLRHGMQRGIVVLVKTENEDELKSNLQVKCLIYILPF